MAQDDLPSVFELTPLNPNFNQNPHALLDKLRDKCPVHRDEVAGTFVLTRYADVRGTLSDTTMWRMTRAARRLKCNSDSGAKPGAWASFIHASCTNVEVLNRQC